MLQTVPKKFCFCDFAKIECCHRSVKQNPFVPDGKQDEGTSTGLPPTDKPPSLLGHEVIELDNCRFPLRPAPDRFQFDPASCVVHIGNADGNHVFDTDRIEARHAGA